MATGGIKGLSDLWNWSSYEIQEEEVGYVWSLKQYAKFRFLPLASPVFEGNKSNHQWELRVGTTSGYLYIFLYLKEKDPNSPGTTVKARVRLSIVNNNGDEKKFWQNSTTDFTDISPSCYFDWSQIQSTTEMFSPTTGLVTEGGDLIIHCRITVEFMRIANGLSGFCRRTVEEVRQDQIDNLCDRFKGFMENSEFSDITVTTETKTFNAHKVVLAGASPVFSAMLTSGMTEETTNEIEITDYGEGIVKGMLDFMYTGTTSQLKENGVDLLRIADKYALEGLKKICEVEIALGLTIENAGDILLLSHQHHTNLLKAAVVSFINRNSKIKDTKSFKNLTKSKIGQEALLEFFMLQEQNGK